LIFVLELNLGMDEIALLPTDLINPSIFNLFNKDLNKRKVYNKI